MPHQSPRGPHRSIDEKCCKEPRRDRLLLPSEFRSWLGSAGVNPFSNNDREHDQDSACYLRASNRLPQEQPGKHKGEQGLGELVKLNFACLHITDGERREAVPKERRVMLGTGRMTPALRMRTIPVRRRVPYRRAAPVTIPPCAPITGLQASSCSSPVARAEGRRCSTRSML